MAKKWSQEEIDFILENWGSLSINSIANRLGRTINAVRAVAHSKLNLKSQIKCTDMLTVPDFANAINVNVKTIYHYINNLNFPCIKKKFTSKRTVMFICIDDFWKWAYNNKSKIDFSLIEPNILGVEPEWVKQERLRDIKYKCKLIGGRSKKWTKEDIELLISLVNKHIYTYDEIAQKLGRTVNSIDTKLRSLGIKSRPARSCTNLKKWTDEEIGLLVKLFKEGYAIKEISEKINRSERGILTKLLRLKKSSLL